MTELETLDELRRVSGFVHLLAAQCQDDYQVSERLPDGRVLAPTCAPDDYERLTLAEGMLREVLDRRDT